MKVNARKPILSVICCLLTTWESMSMEDEQRVFQPTTDKSVVEEFYKDMAKWREVEIDIVKGKRFKPREFWDQDASVILEFLKPELQKCLIPEIIRVNQSYNRDFPIEVEYIFQSCVLNKINVFMKNKGLPPVDNREFFESLSLYDEKEPSEMVKALASKGIHYSEGFSDTPLFDYFAPYFKEPHDDWIE